VAQITGEIAIDLDGDDARGPLDQLGGKRAAAGTDFND
jgi:hypothetical protein